MNVKIVLIAATAFATGGCATFATFELVQNAFTGAIITRALTVQPPASEQKITAFVGWNPGAGSVTKIVRERAKLSANDKGAVTEFTSGFSPPFFQDSSVSAGVKYKYTLHFDNNGKTSTRSNTIEPVAAVSDAAALTGPGSGILEFATGKKAVGPSRPDFAWAALPEKNANQSYGFFLIVGKVDPSSQTGIDPVYSAFLDESKHPTGVKFGTKSDLEGFSTEFLDNLKSIPEISFLAPKDKKPDGSDLDALESGREYAWTILTVNSDLRHISFGIGKISAPTDSKRFRYFQVQ